MNSRRGKTSRQRHKKNISPLNQRARYEKLLKWMGQKGFKNPKKLKPHVFWDTGRGLMAKKGISKGDTIITIPGDILITPSYVLKTHIGSFILKHCFNATGTEILAVFLMCENVLKDKSSWFPYINSLPSTYTVPTFFQPELLEALPSTLKQLLQYQLENTQKSYQKLNCLLTTLGKVSPCYRSLENSDFYSWALTTVNTRCVYKKCCSDCVNAACTLDLALAPFLDFLNHNINTQVEAHFNPKLNCFQIKSHGDFKKYSQVFISYGGHSNRKLFLEYGFVIAGNENDVIPVSLEDVSMAYSGCWHNPVPFDRITFLTKRQLTSNLGITIDGPNWNLEVLLSVLCEENDVSLWKKTVDGQIKNTNTKGLKLKLLLKKLVYTKLEEYENLIRTGILEKREHFPIEHYELVHKLLLIEKSILLNVFLNTD